MTGSNGRMRGAPADLYQIINGLQKRIKDLESVQRLGFSSFEAGTILVLNVVPEVRFQPDYQSNHFATQYAYGYTDTTLPDDTGTVANFYIASWNGTDFVADGGKLLLDSQYLYLSHQPLVQNNGNETFIQLNAVQAAGGPNGVFRLQGLWFNNTQFDGLQAILPASFTTGAGFSSFTFTYFATFSGAMWPVCTLLNTSGGAVAWCLTAASASAFTIAWATGTTDKRVMLWGVRMDT